MVKAGVMLVGDGLQPSSKGARISIAPDGKRTVTDGPFTETKELIAVAWHGRCAGRSSARGRGRIALKTEEKVLSNPTAKVHLP
jgi:hypothetical protein